MVSLTRDPGVMSDGGSKCETSLFREVKNFYYVYFIFFVVVFLYVFLIVYRVLKITSNEFLRT